MKIRDFQSLMAKTDYKTINFSMLKLNQFHVNRGNNFWANLCGHSFCFIHITSWSSNRHMMPFKPIFIYKEKLKLYGHIEGTYIFYDMFSTDPKPGMPLNTCLCVECFGLKPVESPKQIVQCDKCINDFDVLSVDELDEGEMFEGGFGRWYGMEIDDLEYSIKTTCDRTNKYYM